MLGGMLNSHIFLLLACEIHDTLQCGADTLQYYRANLLNYLFSSIAGEWTISRVRLKVAYTLYIF